MHGRGRTVAYQVLSTIAQKLGNNVHRLLRLSLPVERYLPNYVAEQRTLLKRLLLSHLHRLRDEGARHPAIGVSNQGSFINQKEVMTFLHHQRLAERRSPSLVGDQFYHGHQSDNNTNAYYVCCIFPSIFLKIKCVTPLAASALKAITSITHLGCVGRLLIFMNMSKYAMILTSWPVQCLPCHHYFVKDIYYRLLVRGGIDVSSILQTILLTSNVPILHVLCSRLYTAVIVENQPPPT